MKHECKGIIVPMVTPFHQNEEVDVEGVRRLSRFLVDNGVHILFPNGSTGEAFSLDDADRRTVLKAVVAEVGGEAPIYAGAGAISTRESIRLAKEAEELGADGLIAITPYYITPNMDECYDHFAAIAKSVKIPLLPYNNPARTGVNITAELTQRLASIENIIGIKDSCGNVQLTAEYISLTPPGFAVFQGQDGMMLASLAIGCVGIVGATGNVCPAVVSDMYNSFLAGDMERAKVAQVKLGLVRKALALGTFPATIKEAMTMLGLPAGPSRRPVKPLTESKRNELRALLEKIEVLPKQH